MYLLVWNISLKELIQDTGKSQKIHKIKVWNISLKELILYLLGILDRYKTSLKYILKGIDTWSIPPTREATATGLKYILKGIDTNITAAGSARATLSLKYILKGIDTGVPLGIRKVCAIVWNISLKELIQYQFFMCQIKTKSLKYILKGIDTYFPLYTGLITGSSLKYILKGIDTCEIYIHPADILSVWNISLKELILVAIAWYDFPWKVWNISLKELILVGVYWVSAANRSLKYILKGIDTRRGQK